MSVDFLKGLPEERQEPVALLLQALRSALPPGFAEHFDGRMVHFSVPHSTYPAGYHCNPASPLPFISVASTKGHIALHHMGLYADASLQRAFLDDWASAGLGKADMGKGCIRFKRMAQLASSLPVLCATFERMTPQQWIERYEAAFKS